MNIAATIVAAFLMQLCGPRAWIYTKPVMLAAAQYNLDPLVLASMQMQESHCSPKATGKLGELGQYQLKRHTRATRGYEHLSDSQLRRPAINTRLGARHLRFCLDFCDGDLPGALGLYSGWPKNKKTGRCRVSNYSRAILARIPDS